MTLRMTLGILVLTALGTPWLAAQEEDILARNRAKLDGYVKSRRAAHKAKLAESNKHYAAALEKLRQARQKKGDLEGLQAAIKEKERFAEIVSVAASDVVESPESLRKLQTAFRAAVGKIDWDHNQRLLALAKNYVSAVEKIKVKLTQAGKLDDAVAAAAELERVKRELYEPTVAASKELSPPESEPKRSPAPKSDSIAATKKAPPFPPRGVKSEFRSRFTPLDLTDREAAYILSAAHNADGVLRLTKSSPKISGSYWLKKKQNVAYGFDTVFQFRITDPRGEGHGCGLALALQNMNATLQWPASPYPWRSIDSGLCVAFDTYKTNAVSVAAGGKGGKKNRVLATTGAIPKITDGKVHTVRAVLKSGKMRVYVDDMKKPALSLSVRMDREVDLDKGKAWVGLVAGNGAAMETHDILNFAFAPSK